MNEDAYRVVVPSSPATRVPSRFARTTSGASVIQTIWYCLQIFGMGAELKLYTGDEYKALLDEQLDTRLEIWDVQK